MKIARIQTYMGRNEKDMRGVDRSGNHGFSFAGDWAGLESPTADLTPKSL